MTTENNRNMTRHGIITAIKEKTGISFDDATTAFNNIIALIEESLIKDEEVKIPSFGTLYTRYKKSRIGRNPKTKVEVEITPRRILSFRASSRLKERVNLSK